MKILVSLIALACINACSSTQTIQENNEELQNQIGFITKEQMLSYWANPLAERFIQNDVKIYRVLYTSNINGEQIALSGAVIIPETENIKGIISIQHATFFADEEAPSENGDFSVVSRKAIFAANGYAVVLPDYLGYGIDKDRVHPYHHAETLAIASFDMILASQQTFRDLGLSIPDKLFLAGYSEGAYATAALQQYNEEFQDLSVTAISLGSGSYDLKATMDLLIDAQQSDFSCMACNAFFLQSYNDYYEMDNPLIKYFKEPFATALEEGLLLGEFNAAEIDQKLTLDPTQLLQESFINEYKNGISIWDEALAENSIHDWQITIPALITHNISDDVSPFFNSERLAMANRENAEVQFQAIPGTNHFDGIFVWGIMTMDYFDGF